MDQISTSNKPGETYMTKFFNRFAKDESGATAIEYGLIAALIAVALIAILGTLGSSLTGTFSKVSSKLTEANS
jgi:pilus assembly protein Flp/PilA